MSEEKIQPRKVLVVDDEPLARLRLQAMVEGLVNYDVVAVADNGDQALRACEEHMPDIVLMDIRMPGIDGLQAARAMATLERPPAVIFCTAYDEHALSAFEASAIDCLLKPIKHEHLLRALAKAGSVNRAQLAHLHSASTAVSGNTQRSIAELSIIVKTPRGEERLALTDIRATYGGFQIGMGAFLLWHRRFQTPEIPYCRV